jgi:hypothetical protein
MAVPRAVPRWFWVVLGALAGSLLVVLVVAVPHLPPAEPRPDRRPVPQMYTPTPRPTYTVPDIPDVSDILPSEAPQGTDLSRRAAAGVTPPGSCRPRGAAGAARQPTR